MPVRRSAAFALCCLAVLATACDTDDGRDLPPAGPDQTLTIATTSTVAAAAAVDGPVDSGSADDGSGAADDDTSNMSITLPWVSGGAIPIDYTCEGADRSPAIEWAGLPDGTVEVAVAVTDLTAQEFVHWVVMGLDPSTGALAEDASTTLGGQAVNGFGNATYGGPCPPSGTHTYRFTVYALGQQLETPAGGPADEALADIGAATLESVSATGTYTAT